MQKEKKKDIEVRFRKLMFFGGYSAEKGLMQGLYLKLSAFHLRMWASIPLSDLSSVKLVMAKVELLGLVY